MKQYASPKMQWVVIFSADILTASSDAPAPTTSVSGGTIPGGTVPGTTAGKPSTPATTSPYGDNDVNADFWQM